MGLMPTKDLFSSDNTQPRSKQMGTLRAIYCAKKTQQEITHHDILSTA